MLAYLWRSIGIDSPPNDQSSADPNKDLVVVTDKDRDEDDFCEISVRPMTWAEVASGAIGRENNFPKVVLTTRRVPGPSTPYGFEEPEIRPKVNSSSWESNELYGELEDNFEAYIQKRHRRKSFKTPRKKRDSL